MNLKQDALIKIDFTIYLFYRLRWYHHSGVISCTNIVCFFSHFNVFPVSVSMSMPMPMRMTSCIAEKNVLIPIAIIIKRLNLLEFYWFYSLFSLICCWCETDFYWSENKIIEKTDQNKIYRYSFLVSFPFLVCLSCLVFVGKQYAHAYEQSTMQ